MEAIVRIGLNDIARRLDNGHSMTLDCSEHAVNSLSVKGYDLRYGARPLNRVLASDVLNPLSRLVLDGGLEDGDVVRVRTRGEAGMDSGDNFGFICADKYSSDENDVVVMRNHRSVEDTECHNKLMNVG